MPLGKLLSLYGKAEMEKYACCFSPVGCLMQSLSNIRLEYRGTEMPLDEKLMNTPIGNIVDKPADSSEIRIVMDACVGGGPCCMVIGCVTKLTTGYGDPRKSVEWLNPSKEWPLVAEEAVRPLEMARDQPTVVTSAVVVEMNQMQAPDIKTKLTELKQMCDDGLITSAEYDAKKAELLKSY